MKSFLGPSKHERSKTLTKPFDPQIILRCAYKPGGNSVSRSLIMKRFWMPPNSVPAAPGTGTAPASIGPYWILYITLPETNSLHLKIGHLKRKIVFQPSIFRLLC